jgi:N-acetyltransferase
VPAPDFAATPTLEGRFVRLEQLDAVHAADLRIASREGDLWRKWTTGIPRPDAIDAEIDGRRALQGERQLAPWAICNAASGAAIGMTSFLHLDAPNRRLEIGSTWIARAAQGGPVNPEAKLLLLTRAFEELDCIAVEFRTHWHNFQSRAAIAGLGAKQDGVLRNHQIGIDGTLRDTVVFSITAAEWPTVRYGLRDRLQI